MRWRTAAGWNPTPYALVAIGMVIIGACVGVVPPALAVFLVVIVVAMMSSTRKRENRARFDEELRQWHARNPDPHHSESPPPAPPAKSGWSTAGTVLAALAAVGGLAILGMVVLLVVAFSTGNLKIGNK